MKLANKFILFITGSKLAIVLLFVWLLPLLVSAIASEYTNYILHEQEKEVLKSISQNGIDYYLQGESGYGSYTLLKDEYISLEHSPIAFIPDTIKESQRIIENDTLRYRVLSKTFQIGNQKYLLEIGKTISSISEYNEPLQRFSLYVMTALILLTIVADITFTRILIQPLGKIIKSRLINRKFPFKEQLPVQIKTSTIDFKYLDESIILLMEQINEAFAKEREFTANASHELMTPVSILQNKLENLLREEELNETAEQRILEIMRTLNRLKRISASLLLISRIENEQFVKKDEVNVNVLIGNVLEEIIHRLEDKNLKLEIDLSPSVWITITNTDLLFQLFYNLINNAIKFNRPDGSIRIKGKLTGSQDFYLEIEDTGYGIPAEQLPHIFNRFRKTSEYENPGYGLGLAIVKSIVNYLQMKIRVDSTIGKGTLFTLVFPASGVRKDME